MPARSSHRSGMPPRRRPVASRWLAVWRLATDQHGRQTLVLAIRPPTGPFVGKSLVPLGP
jgi:hypothetical protein